MSSHLDGDQFAALDERFDFLDRDVELEACLGNAHQEWISCFHRAGKLSKLTKLYKSRNSYLGLKSVSR